MYVHLRYVFEKGGNPFLGCWEQIIYDVFVNSGWIVKEVRELLNSRLWILKVKLKMI